MKITIQFYIRYLLNHKFFSNYKNQNKFILLESEQHKKFSIFLKATFLKNYDKFFNKISFIF